MVAGSFPGALSMLSPRATPVPSWRQRPSFIRRFGDDANGGIAIIFALMFVALALFVGAAVDIGRWSQARNQTAAALDAAVLAGARMLQLNRTDVAGAIKVAQKYYSENIKGRIEVIGDTPTFNAINNNSGFTGTSHSSMKTSFLGFARVSTLPLDIYSEAALPNKPLEVSMMLDVTGSMSGSKITDLKKSATDLVNIVIPDGSQANPVRVAIVPFSEGVRLPSSANDKARGSNLAPSITIAGQTYNRTDCVVERMNSNRYTDVSPGDGNFVGTLYKHPWWGTGTCPLTASEELVPLTKDKSVLKARIDGLRIDGSTAGHIGTAWAWYTLSPNWNSLWGASSAATAYDSDTRKVAILMTDGDYNTQYDSNGVSGNGANGSSANQAKSLCSAMKDKGILVYTVGFQVSSSAKNLLAKCASDASMAYSADNGNELQQAFRDIALKINQLYLTQ
jgi:Flp pilus assembly protein TadG